MDLTHPIGQWLSQDDEVVWVSYGRTLFYKGTKVAIYYDTGQERVCVIAQSMEPILSPHVGELRTVVLSPTEFNSVIGLFEARDEIKRSGVQGLDKSGVSNQLMVGLSALLSTLCPMSPCLANAARKSKELPYKTVLCLLAVADVLPERYTHVISIAVQKGKVVEFEVEDLEGSIQVIERSYAETIILLSSENDGIKLKLKYPDALMFALRPS